MATSKKSKLQSIHSINDQLVLTVEEISNNDIHKLAKSLTNKGVNVEVQSINKQNKTIVIVFKLSDFNLDKLTVVEDF